MNTIKTMLERISANRELKKLVGEARDEFESKPYAIEYKQIYKAVKSTRFIPSLFSIVGAMLTFSIVFNVFNQSVSLLIGLLVGVCFEVFKDKVIEVTYRYILKGGKKIYILVNILLLLVSAISTIYGTVIFADMTKKVQLTNNKASYELQKDSIATHFDMLIEQNRNDLKTFEDKTKIRSGKYSGQIAWTSRNQYNTYIDRDISLKAQKETALTEFEATKPNQDRIATQYNDDQLIISIIFAIMIEIIILIMGRFLVYYRYMAAKEVNDLEALQDGQIIELNINSIGSLLQSLGARDSLLIPAQSPSDQPPATVAPPKRIGFQVVNSQPNPKPASQTVGERVTSNVPIKGKQRGGLEARECEHCKALYYPYNVPQRFCSKDCNHAYHGFTL